jgi:hypothetical protein
MDDLLLREGLYPNELEGVVWQRHTGAQVSLLVLCFVLRHEGLKVQGSAVLGIL